ncbi:uncharacterized protein ALTATR162_LOCUS8702 [Alternaria atra]|uniref:Uncharacterized protein n=1 Tax=Alternaria atra TaxID=119953 RepID=A0A8J2N2X1_9PLEO|nr:uncharacterized protein ALTATR162_LOCUS8702 [Alternaria atra]CAG5178441.1 unnamed protein product [Alternaria atra]
MGFYERIYNDKKDVSRIGYTDITEVTEKIEHLNSTKTRDGGAVELGDGWITVDRKSPLSFSVAGFRSRN